MAKTKAVQKTAYMWHSGPKGQLVAKTFNQFPDRTLFTVKNEQKTENKKTSTYKKRFYT